MIILVTCKTVNCENSNIAIPFPDPQELVICGPCGQEITDKVEQLDNKKASAE
jgi:ribosomal protein S27E